MQSARGEAPQGRSGDEAYQYRILQGVSRTFALTIPQLPPELYPVVANGYLLCRIADTIEDEPGLSLDQKGHFFAELVDVVSGAASPASFAEELLPLLSEVTLPAEKDLIQNTPRVIHVTLGFNRRQRTALERCVRIMCEGMQRFQGKKSLRGLENMEELDHYCYHVAGVVGEMLTELFCDYSKEISREKDQLFQLAASFGQGLQMTNILKDVWEDRKRGACWLPRQLFLEDGFNLEELSERRSGTGFEKGLVRLIAIARLHLYNALAYTLLVPRHETGIRKFCLWALGMAVLTLRKINRHRGFTNGRQVKISRRSVLWTVRVTNLTSRGDRVLRLLFEVLSLGLPKVPVDGKPAS